MIAPDLGLASVPASYQLVQRFKRSKKMIKAKRRGVFRWAVTALIAALAIIAPQIHDRGVAFAYSCGTAHCYKGIHWGGHVSGESTDIYIAPLTAPNDGGFVDNETWLVDLTGPYWVEIGYSTFGSSSVQYFWADSRPGSTYYEHPMASVAGNEYGTRPQFAIQHGSGNSWVASIVGPGSNFGGSWTSTNNTMTGNDIQIGQELAGTTGASANYANFTINVWYGYYDGSFHYQTNSGQDLNLAYGSTSNPPYGGWDVIPQNSTTGGQFTTNCC